MRPIYSCTLLALLVLAPVARAVPINAVPDQRPQSAVVDLTGTLTPLDVEAVNVLAQRGKAGGELYVAVIGSLDGEPSRGYATLLFNRLRLDASARNRGVLLLAALDDRKAEIILGDGFSTTTTQVTDAIMRDVVVAHFKSRDPRGAMVEGARAVVDRVLLEGASTTSSSAAPFEAWQLATNLAGANPIPFWAGLGVLGIGALVGTRRFLRYRPRGCERCGQSMVLLDENQDDDHLDSGQQTEESLGSVDYDVWLCLHCQNVLALRYGAIFTRYSGCPECNAKTKSSQSTTLDHATEYSTGLAQIDDRCAHCGYHRSYTRVLPRVTPSSSSSSSSSSHSSSGGGSSSGSGSSGSW
jgi:uncharacterized protein